VRSVICTVEGINLLNDDGLSIPSVRVTCGKCGHEVESFGTSDRSVKRCLAVMHTECQREEDNFYKVEAGSEPKPRQKAVDMSEIDWNSGRYSLDGQHVKFRVKQRDSIGDALEDDQRYQRSRKRDRAPDFDDDY